MRAADAEPSRGRQRIPADKFHPGTSSSVMQHMWAGKRAKHKGGWPEAVGRRSHATIVAPAGFATAAEKARKERVNQKKPKGELF